MTKFIADQNMSNFVKMKRIDFAGIIFAFRHLKNGTLK